MEDYLHWAETFGELVVPVEQLDEKLLTMWLALQRAVRHYFRATHPTSGRYRFTDATCDAAHRDLWQFTELSKQVSCSAHCLPTASTKLSCRSLAVA